MEAETCTLSPLLPSAYANSTLLHDFPRDPCLPATQLDALWNDRPTDRVISWVSFSFFKMRLVSSIPELGGENAHIYITAHLLLETYSHLL